MLEGEEDSCTEKEKDRDLPNIDMSEDSQQGNEGKCQVEYVMPKFDHRRNFSARVGKDSEPGD
jgi:hypothetical protein